MSIREKYRVWRRNLQVASARQKKFGRENAIPTGRVIDMTPKMQTWGWDFSGWDYDKETDTIRTSGWCWPRPKVGDLIDIEFRLGGVRRLMFLNVEYVLDPNDMWHGNLVLPPEDKK